MKKLIIIILLLLVLGLYFFTAPTKVFMQKTGYFIKAKLLTPIEEREENVKDTIKKEENKKEPPS